MSGPKRHLPVVKSVRESEEFLGLPLSDYMLAAEYAFIPQVKGWNEIKINWLNGQG